MTGRNSSGRKYAVVMVTERRIVSEKTTGRADEVARTTVWTVCAAFASISLVRFAIRGEGESALLSLATLLLVCLPGLAERVFRARMSTPIYLVVLLYTVCPLLGDSYKLYYLVSWWDKLLHTTGGVVFAIVGSYLPVVLRKEGKPSIWERALFGLCFSMAVSVTWEFFEFAMDMWLGTDMQNDTVIDSISSYLLGSAPGVLGGTGKIESVVINGVPMEGYIDIGLIDTMCDMLVETFGALVYTVWLLTDKDRHPAWVPYAPVSEQVAAESRQAVHESES